VGKMPASIQFGEAEWVNNPVNLYIGNQQSPLRRLHEKSLMIPTTLYTGKQITRQDTLHAQQLYDPAIIYAGSKMGYIKNQYERNYPDYQQNMMEDAAQQLTSTDCITQQNSHAHLQKQGDADWQGVIFGQVNEKWEATNYAQYCTTDEFEPMHIDSFTMDPYGHEWLPFQPTQFDMVYHYGPMPVDEWSRLTAIDSTSGRSRSDNLSRLSPITTPTINHLQEPGYFQTSPPIAQSLVRGAAEHHQEPQQEFSYTPNDSYHPTTELRIEEAVEVADHIMGEYRYPVHGKTGSKTIEAHSYEPEPSDTRRRRFSCPNLSFVSETSPPRPAILEDSPQPLIMETPYLLHRPSAVLQEVSTEFANEIIGLQEAASFCNGKAALKARKKPASAKRYRKSRAGTKKTQHAKVLHA